MASTRKIVTCVSGCGAAVALAIACGKVDDPKPLEVSKLKPAMRLQAIPGDCTDETHCSITLKWTANNNEDDFSGFNVYMSETSPADLKTAFGLSTDAEDPQALSPIPFQDAEGNEIADVKVKLATHFNVDPSTKAWKDNSAEKKYNPLVRCNVRTQDAGGECVAITDADKSHEEYRANGFVSYTVTGLAKGKIYSFFVSSTMDSGKKAVFPGTNVMWARPRAVQTLDFETPYSASKFHGYELKADGTVAKSDFTKATDYCTPGGTGETNTHVYFDVLSGTKQIQGANGTRIADLGPIVALNGDLYKFDDQTGVNKALATVNTTYRLWGTALVPKADGTILAGPRDLGVKAGYSVCGESIPLFSYHLYAIAIPTNAEKTTFRYALLGFEDGTTPSIRVAVGAEGDLKL